MPKNLLLENIPCNRCGGSGRMPYSVYAGLCFKCSGAGAILTKRGRAAQLWMNSQREKFIEEFEVGDLLYMPGFSAGSYAQPNRWLTVTEVVRLNGDEAGYVGRPDLQCVKILARCGTEENHGVTGFVGGTKYRYGMTAAQKADLRARALAYQATLTKSGTVRKTRSKQPEGVA